MSYSFIFAFFTTQGILENRGHLTRFHFGAFLHQPSWRQPLQILACASSGRHGSSAFLRGGGVLPVLPGNQSVEPDWPSL
jgi:hypothetical protein